MPELETQDRVRAQRSRFGRVSREGAQAPIGRMGERSAHLVVKEFGDCEFPNDSRPLLHQMEVAMPAILGAREHAEATAEPRAQILRLRQVDLRESNEQ